MTKRRNVLLTVLMSVCLCLCAMGTVMFAAADDAGGGASSQQTKGVIEAEVEFGGKLENGAAGAASWGTSGEARKISPIASDDEYSLEKIDHNDGWLNNIQRTLTTPIDAATELGITITGEGNAKVSNMGVAVWIYVGDESTLVAMKDANLKAWVGPAGGSTWHEDQKLSVGGELVVGWNEVVLIHNPNWYATYSQQTWTANPTDDQINSIAYLSVELNGMAEAAKKLALNNIRLVRTTQTKKLVINRQEKYAVDDATSIDLTDALKSIAGAQEVETELPDGSTGKAVKFNASANQGGAFANPVNATTPAHGWNENYNMWSSNVTLSFWWYLEDAVTYKEFVANATSGWSAFQISSVGDSFGADGTVGFNIKDSNGTGSNKTETDMFRYFNTGWNHIFISFWGNNIDLTSIKAFRLLNFNGAQQDALFYDMKIARGNIWQRGVVNDGASGDPFPDATHKADIFKGDDAATVTNWTGVSDTLSDKVPADTTYKKSLSATIGATSTTVEYEPTDMDLSSFTEKFLTLTAWIYTDNARALNSKDNLYKPSVSVAESKTGLETAGYTVEMGTGFVNGWNQIKVRFTDASKINEDQELDLSNLNYYKFSFPIALGADKTLLITGVTLNEENSRDAFRIVKRLPDIDTTAPDATRKSAIPFQEDPQDEIESWDQNAFGIMPYSPDKGNKSVYFQNGNDGVVQSKHRFAPVDLSEFNMSHTVLTFWIYINDVEALLGNDGQLELGNGNSEDDANEIGWDITKTNLGQLGLQSGKWNKLAFKIRPEGYPGSANVKGNVDFTEIRFMRFYSLNKKEGSAIRLLISSLQFEEMDTSDFVGTREDVKLLETKELTEGTTPGAIDIYDMLASSDGTFPQARSLTLTSDKTTIKVGEFAQLTATVDPEYAPKNATYTVNDDEIASVDSTGKVTGLKAGEVTITATTSNGKKASVTITVTAADNGDNNPGGDENDPGDGEPTESGKKKKKCGGFAGSEALPIAAGLLIAVAGTVMIARKKKEN